LSVLSVFFNGKSTFQRCLKYLKGEITVKHTDRVALVARQKRSLTQKLVREAVERYFETLAEEIARGEQVELFGIGRIQVSREEGHGILYAIGPSGTRIPRKAGFRLRTRIRLFEAFRQRCHEQRQNHVR
jgi:hypothetical protein